MALEGAKVIDGTGGKSKDKVTILIRDGKIADIGKTIAIPDEAQRIDMNGFTILPGIVGLHEHLHYTYRPAGSERRFLPQQPWSFPRLYLASGVTTARTAGTHDPYTELGLKKLIDTGKLIGPKLHLTAPYIGGAESDFPFRPYIDPLAVKKMVNYWADEGFTSFKLYMSVDRAVALAAIQTAHARGLKVTGHLWKVTFEEATKMGIDNLEHGLSTSSDLVPNKQPDKFPPSGGTLDLISTINSPEMKRLIDLLVKQKVVITSTLANYEASQMAHLRDIDPRVMKMLAPQMRESVLARRQELIPKLGPANERKFKLEMEFEKAFAAAGGLLVAGSDPTSYGSVVAGLANHRQIELLVEAGFTVAEAIKIATLNGAHFLGVDGEVGSIEVGKVADLMIVKGDVEKRISDIRNVFYVFKDGVGYDSSGIFDGLKGKVGLQ